MTAPDVTTRLALLGPIQLEQAGQIVRKVGSQKSLAMLGYLVRHRQAVRRSALAGLLWPDKPEANGRKNVRWALNNLSKFFPDCFTTTPDTIKFQPTPTIWLDTVTFETLAAGDITSLVEAAALYRGDFMADLSLDDSPEWEMWLLRERELWQQQVVRVLERLIVSHTEAGQYESGQRFATRLLTLNPWHEAAYRHLMRLLALNGQRNEALAQYERCRQTLAEGLDVEPAPETVTLYEQIRTGSLNGPPQPPQEDQSAPLPTFASASPPPCPYRGLFAFHEEDAPFFFGREVFTERLVKAVERQAMLAVVGPSGSGKTSVIYAGLVAHLRRQNSWLIADFRPGSRPFYDLAGALVRLLEPHLSETQQLVNAKTLGDALNRGDLLLYDVVERIRQKNPKAARFLLIANQFEELYTLCSELETRRHFLDMLSEAVSLAHLPPGAPPPLNLVLTLRADFMGQALSHRPFADALQDADIKLGPMTREELRRAIEKPAEKLGVGYETGLVERILDDVGHKPGNLPLLEFALAAVWPYQRGGILSHVAYETIGRVSGSLARYADKVYAGLNDHEQKQTRRIFVQMVRPGARTEDTRRMATRAELGEAGWPLTQSLADARLVVTGRNPDGEQTVEVVHEALIQHWGRLQKWLNEDRAFRIWQERLRTALRQWLTSNRDEGALLRGALLAEAEAWAKTRTAELSPVEQEFLEASVTLQDQKLLVAEEQRQRELAQAQALAEAERQRAEDQLKATRRLRWLAGGLAVIFLVAVGAAIFADIQQQEAQRQAEAAQEQRQEAEIAKNEAETAKRVAEEQARLALSRQLGAQAIRYTDEQPDLSLLLSLEAGRFAESFEESENLLVDLKYNPLLSKFLHGHTDAVQKGIAFSPDGQTLASAGTDQTVILWDVATGQSLFPPLAKHTAEIVTVAFSPDGTILASAGQDHTILLWNVKTGQSLGSPLVGHQDTVRSLIFSPDGKTLISGSSDGTVRLWDVATGQEVDQPLTNHAGGNLAFSRDRKFFAASLDDGKIGVWNLETGQQIGTSLVHDGNHDLVFSPDGQTLASSSFDQTIILWDVESDKPLLPPLTGHRGRVLVSAFSPDGQILASGSTDNTIILWDTETGQPLGDPLIGHTNWVRGLDFSPDGQTLASGGADGSVILWDIGARTRLTGHTAEVRGVAFSPDNRTLVSGSWDNTVRFWDLSSKQPIGDPLTGHTGLVLNVAFSPDGKTVASASTDGTVIVWDAATHQAIGQPLAAHEGGAIALAFSPDGQILASGGFDNAIVLWDVTRREAIGEPLLGHEGWVIGVAFSPDDQTLASASADGTVMLWDVGTGQPLGPPWRGHTNWVNSVSFSPDGQILASGSSDNTIILWDVTTAEPIGQPLTGHTAQVWSVVFNPQMDGNILISGAADGTVIVWDVPTQRPLLPPITNNTEMETMTISHDGQTLAIGGFDHSVTLWKLNYEDWPTRACRIANRNLSQAEWETFIGSEIPYRRTCPDLPPGP